VSLASSRLFLCVTDPSIFFVQPNQIICLQKEKRERVFHLLVHLVGWTRKEKEKNLVLADGSAPDHMTSYFFHPIYHLDSISTNARDTGTARSVYVDMYIHSRWNLAG
jgi:hypothetical protein